MKIYSIYNLQISLSFKNNKIGLRYSNISTICVGNISIFVPGNLATRFVANKYSWSDIDYMCVNIDNKSTDLAATRDHGQIISLQQKSDPRPLFYLPLYSGLNHTESLPAWNTGYFQLLLAWQPLILAAEPFHVHPGINLVLSQLSVPVCLPQSRMYLNHILSFSILIPHIVHLDTHRLHTLRACLKFNIHICIDSWLCWQDCTGVAITRIDSLQLLLLPTSLVGTKLHLDESTSIDIDRIYIISILDYLSSI